MAGPIHSKGIKIFWKIFFGFTCIIVFLVIQGLVGILKTGDLGNLIDNIYTKSTLVSTTKDLKNLLYIYRLHTFAIMGTEETEQHKNLIDKMAETQMKIEEIASNEQLSQYSAQLETFHENWQKVIQSNTREENGIFQLVGVFDNETATEVVHESSPSYDTAVSTIELLVTQLEDNSKMSYSATLNIKKITNFTMWGLMTGGILFALILAIALSKTLTNPLNVLKETVTVVQKQGDLTLRADLNSKDEIGEIAIAFNSFIESLQHTIGAINTQSDELEIASSELSATMSEINNATEEVNKNNFSTTEITGNTINSLQELAQSIQKINENIFESLTEAKKAKESASKGTEAVDNTSNSMKKIEESSRNITKVVEVIQDISNQTNLLSLNAAIEAVKAGEAGKGFAVVADEVRRLADHSTKSISEIQEQINISSTNVYDGVSVVGDTGEILKDIISHISLIYSSVENVSSSMSQQEKMTNQISEDSSEISRQNEGNAAALEQLTATINNVNQTTKNLSKMAEELRSSISQFKIA